MSWRARPRRRKQFGEFRPSGLTQHAEMSMRDQVEYRRAHPHDTAGPGRSAREWFAFNRPIVAASRPLLEVVDHPYLRDDRGRPVRVEVLGAPTFRNSIDENGALR